MIARKPLDWRLGHQRHLGETGTVGRFATVVKNIASCLSSTKPVSGSDKAGFAQGTGVGSIGEDEGRFLGTSVGGREPAVEDDVGDPAR